MDHLGEITEMVLKKLKILIIMYLVISRHDGANPSAPANA
nr:MAG TPA: hypothetical protein [Caudoviricetes sp.]